MRIFISVDIEGVAGVQNGIQGRPGNPEYETARRLMTQEANAAIRGAFAGGATEVLVADSHGQMRNMLADELDPRARLIQGKPRPLSMIQGVEADHAGVVLIGYHAAAGNRGTLAHTVSGMAFARIELNGLQAGEPTLFAGHASEIGVPLLAVSGDDLLAEEIAAQFPAASRIVVKRAIGAAMTDSLSPAASCALIETGVRDAVAQAAQVPVQAPVTPPLEVMIHLNRQIYADAAALIPMLTRSGPHSVSFTAASHGEVIGVLSALSLMALALG